MVDLPAELVRNSGPGELFDGIGRRGAHSFLVPLLEVFDPGSDALFLKGGHVGGGGASEWSPEAARGKGHPT